MCHSLDRVSQCDTGVASNSYGYFCLTGITFLTILILETHWVLLWKKNSVEHSISEGGSHTLIRSKSNTYMEPPLWSVCPTDWEHLQRLQRVKNGTVSTFKIAHLKDMIPDYEICITILYANPLSHWDIHKACWLSEDGRTGLWASVRYSNDMWALLISKVQRGYFK